MIIRGGENVYPREIEEFLYTHPAVEDVQIIGVPNKKVRLLDFCKATPFVFSYKRYICMY